MPTFGGEIVRRLKSFVEEKEAMIESEATKEVELLEQNFRQGFHRGYSQAIEAIARGKTVEEARAFAENQLYQWRFFGDHKHHDPAPTLID